MAICPVARIPCFPTVPGHDLLCPLFSVPKKRKRERIIPPRSKNGCRGRCGEAQCGFAYSVWPQNREHYTSWIVGIWILNMTMRLLFQSNSLNGCLLKTFVVWTGIWGRGRSHLFWNPLPITWSNYCRAKWRASNRKFLSGVSRPCPLSAAIVLMWRLTRRFQRQGHGN